MKLKPEVITAGRKLAKLILGLVVVASLALLVGNAVVYTKAVETRLANLEKRPELIQKIYVRVTPSPTVTKAPVRKVGSNSANSK